METLVSAGTLAEECALQVAEAILHLRNAEGVYRQVCEQNPELGNAWRKRAAEKVRDANVESQVRLIAYEFVRGAPIYYPPGHKVRLGAMRYQKLEGGWTLEMLAGRLAMPEATLMVIEDGQEVSVGLGARIAHVMGVKLRELVLEEGQSLEEYWHDLGRGKHIV